MFRLAKAYVDTAALNVKLVDLTAYKLAPNERIVSLIARLTTYFGKVGLIITRVSAAWVVAVVP